MNCDMIVSIVEELKPHLQFNEHTYQVAQIKQHMDKAAAAADNQQKLLKDLVKGMNDSITDMHEEIARVERGEEELRALQAAIEQRENTILQLQAMEGQSELVTHQLRELEAQKHDLKEQELELKNTKLTEIPVIKHALGLYANITNLRWNYDSDQVVKGHITKNDDIRNFEIKDADAVRVADQLWGMM